ncbi:DUF1329 domain-containing protein [Pseudomonas sp. zbq_18]|uniref:DUF1329 domain-containing protein n=1 Tax=Pseudomonas sp. zbq_18 TaxID=3367251 RepID=UPI00370AB856
MFISRSLIAAAVAIACTAGSAMAAVSPQEAAKLGQTLTPYGAEKAGNADGTIPEWTGGITQPPAGYKGSGQHHIDPFPDDKPLFTITRANLEQYQDKLSAGQIALLKSYPETYQIPVYQSRRTGSAPQWVYDNTIKNATTAKLVEGGNGFVDAYGGIPFPIPQSGVEALWNHIVRYRGSYITRRSAEVAVQRNGAYSPVVSEVEALFRYYDPKGSYADLNNILFYYLNFTKSPARLAGDAALVHETLDQVKEARQAWGYAAGQRRVRRAPNLAYDTPIGASEGLRTADDTDMFNGAPDRYDWKLLGKKEMYIPYNNYRLAAQGVKYKDVLQVGHINPQLTRNELHRVWVVEGTLKPGVRHVYAKRTLFLDEDSWQAAVMDQYDSRGELWRVSIAYLKNYYDLPTTWSAMEAFHDLQSRRYHVQNLDSEESSTANFSKPIPAESEFTPSALRRRGTR